MVAVIAIFTGLDYAIPAILVLARRGATIIVHVVAVVALFEWRIEDTVSTCSSLELACKTAIARFGIAIIALLTGLHNRVPTELNVTRGRATIAINVVAIVTCLPSIDDAIAARRNMLLLAHEKHVIEEVAFLAAHSRQLALGTNLDKPWSTLMHGRSSHTLQLWDTCRNCHEAQSTPARVKCVERHACARRSHKTGNTTHKTTESMHACINK